MNLSPVFRQRFFDSNGLPLAGGQLFTYQAGTVTPQVTYSNSIGTTNTNPVVLDASGYADVWLDPTLAYKFVLEDVNSVVQWTVDNVSTLQGLTTWSANTTYSQGSIVEDSSGFGVLYVSLLNNNVGNALTNVSAWRIYQGNERTVSTNTTLLVTDDILRSNSTAGSILHTLPACSTTPVGKKIIIKDIGTGGNYTQVQGHGTDQIDGNNIYSGNLLQYSSLEMVNNGSSWDVLAIPPSKSIQQSNLALKSTGTSVGIGGVAISASSGSFITSSSTFTPVTNLSVTVITSGRPVLIFLQPDGTTGVSNLNVANSASYMSVEVLRGATAIYDANVGGAAGQAVPPGSVLFIDQPAAGTYTYSIDVKSSGGSCGVNNSVLVAYEI